MRSGPPRQAAEAGVRAAVRALAAGRMVVVADDREREDEGDLVAAAALISAEQMAFFLRHGAVTAHNIAYLRTKRDRMGHDLDLPVQLARATLGSLRRLVRLSAQRRDAEVTRDRLSPVDCPEFAQDVAHVCFHRAFGDD